MQKIAPCLWFDSEGEEAAKFYCSIFPNSKILYKGLYTTDTPSNKPKGSVMTVDFEINGQRFMALNGGSFFKLNPSISFFVLCKYEEIEELWKKLSSEGTTLMPLSKYHFSEKYGWLQDKYGVSWQLMVETKKETQKIIPSLLFVGNVYGRAHEAMKFYISIFKDSKMNQVSHYTKGDAQEGKISYAQFELFKEKFVVMDSGFKHNFSFSEATSFMIYCDNQKEMDYYYDKLSAVPEAEVCGWLKDKFGVSWQLVTIGFEKLMTGKNAEKVMKELMKMKRLDIKKLEDIHNGK